MVKQEQCPLVTHPSELRMSSNQKPKLGANGELINLPASAEMTDELLLSSFKNIEAKFKLSDTYKDLDRLLQDYLKKSKNKVLTCVCFGTGTFSGFCDKVQYAETYRQPVGDENTAYMMWKHHDIAMYQLAAFKGAIDVIEKLQGWRPLAYAQEPEYNDFDSVLLQQLQITKVNTPRGFNFVRESSLTYCPVVPFLVLHNIVARSPVINLATNLQSWSREHWESLPAEYTESLLRDSESCPYMQGVQTIEAYLATQDMQKVEGLEIGDAPDGVSTPFRNLQLYSAKFRRRGLTF